MKRDKAVKKIKTDVIMKHVDLVIEGLANMPKNKQAAGIFVQVLLIATFLSFINDIGLEAEKELGIK